MSIQTVQSRARRTHRLNQLNGKVEGVLAAMRNGAVLRRVHHPSSVVWVLSPAGEMITTEVAHLITQRTDIAGVGDCLFDVELSQTWRFIGR